MNVEFSDAVLGKVTFVSSAQQRAQEVVAWRAYVEQQEKVKKDVEVIEAKQKEHRMEYEKKQQKLAHLTWRQRKAVLYKENKHLMFLRPKERTEMDKNVLSVIVKGADLFCLPLRCFQMLSLEHHSKLLTKFLFPEV